MMKLCMGLPRLMCVLLGATLLIPSDTSQAASAIAPACVPADAVDLALDFVPGVCVVKDLLALGLGVNLITGETVSATDGATLVGWLVAPAALRRGRRLFAVRAGALWRRLLIGLALLRLRGATSLAPGRAMVLGNP